MSGIDGGTVGLHVEQHTGGSVATVTIDRPGKANALNSALMTELAAVLAELGRADDLRVVVLTGAGGRSFIAGADVGEMAGLDPHTARAFIGRVHACCHAIRDLPVPVIARIGGATFGAGLEIAASCDLRIAVDTAVFGMPEVRLGIPSVVEAALLPMLVGWGRARQILLLGDTFGAADAAAWGLVERIVAPDKLDAAVAEWVASLLACQPGAVRVQKRLMRQWEDLPLRAAVQAGVDAFAGVWGTGEPEAAMRAFGAAKRT